MLPAGIAAALVVLIVIAAFLYRPMREMLGEIELEKAMKQFSRQRERLEAKFFDMARGTGKPRGLVWDNCEFYDDVRFARDKSSGELGAFVEMTIRFSAVPGGDMEGVAAVANLRHATAVFFYRDDRWMTEGRVLFNMNPDEAIRRFHSQFESISTTLG